MNWDQIGAYCGRDVVMARLESFADGDAVGDLSDSTLLLVTETDASFKPSRDTLFRGLASASPLSICLFGEDSDAAFDSLLEVLSTYPSRGHIMTQLFSSETFQEGFHEFLCSSWPSEERHDDWVLHRVLVVGSESVYTRHLGQARQILAE